MVNEILLAPATIFSVISFVIGLFFEAMVYLLHRLEPIMPA